MADAPDRNRKLPWFKKSPADLLSHPGMPAVLGDMRLLGILHLLELMTWGNGPVSLKLLSATTGGTEDIERLEALGFLTVENGSVSVKWLEAERIEGSDIAAEISDKRREAAKASWEARRKMHEHANAMQVHASVSKSMQTDAQDRTGQDRTGQDRTGQDRTRQEIQSSPPLASLATDSPSAASTKEKLDRKEASGDHAALVRFHAEKYLHLCGSAYVFGKDRDGKIIKEMLANAGSLEKAKAKIERGFQDPWLKERGCALPLIWSKWNSLVPASAGQWNPFADKQAVSL